MLLPQFHLVMGMCRFRCLKDCTFWVNIFRGDLTENLSVCVVAMRIGIESTSLEELAGQNASTWPRVTMCNKPGAPPITQDHSMSSVGPATIPYHRPVPGASGARAAAVSTGQRGPLQAMVRSMIDLRHRVAGLEHDPSPAPSLSAPLLSLGSTRGWC